MMNDAAVTANTPAESPATGIALVRQGDTGIPSPRSAHVGAIRYPLQDHRSVLRSLMESAVCLLLAVILFRTFAAEGYMISTGSMAPHLLGFHKRVECPSCHYGFPFGIAYDTDPSASEAASRDDPARMYAVCPNCGQRGINLQQVPRNHGDQLLVYKPAYAFRAPRRWEIVVFRNPHDPREAYVKRAVGLPGERVQIIDGDVYANGQICRKDWATQRQLRLAVHSHDHQPESGNTQGHWSPLPPAEAVPEWKTDARRFVRDDLAQPGWAWIEYASRLRYRGHHETVVPLADWPDDIDPTSIPPAGLRFDARSQTLRCIGALPAEIRDRLLNHPGPESFHAAVQQLYEDSQVVPVTDEYGYNPHDGSIIPVPVRDVMVSTRVEITGGEGEFAIEMTDGHANYTCTFDIGRHLVRLYAAEHADPVCEDELPAGFGESSLVEVSLFDRQVLVAVDGQPVLSPWVFETPESVPHPRYPIRMGSRQLQVALSELVVYRDVYYTGTRSRHAISQPYELGPDELFVLGDNSPVSHDSRRWTDGAVKTSLLIGKPFIVHLPSKPGRVRLGPLEAQLRLPDFDRIQWLK